MKLPGLLAALLAAGLASAQSPPSPDQPAWTQQFSGYFKNLVSESRSYFTGERWVDNLDRLRLTYDGKYGDWFSVHLDYDNEVHAGTFTETPDFEIVRGREGAAWLNIQATLADHRNLYADTSLYRGFITLHKDSATLTLGRQRIGWGTAHFWSPMDMFNPISPLQVEPSERQAVDAALIEFASPGELRWNLVYAPQDGFRRSSSAVRISRTFFNYDFDAVAARFGQDWTAGVDFAGQIRGAGVRGESTYRWRHPIPGEPVVSTRDAFRLVLGGDYAFANGLYLTGEYFYNQGQPDSKPGGALDPGVLLQYSSEIFTLRRHFVSGGASYPITPLWKVEMYAVADVTGPSVVVLPRLTHNLTANTDLNFGLQLFGSSKAGEFRGISDLAYVEFVLHFR